VVSAAYVSLTDDGRRWASETLEGLSTSSVPGAQWVYETAIKPFADPVREKLLPDFPPFPEGHVAPRTLVVDLEETLCHLEWDQRYGWRTVKRPHVDTFLTRAALAGYEVVVFTTGNSFFLEPIALALDPRGMVSHRLYRESTRFDGTKHVKDLPRLNRDLRNVICVDDDVGAVGDGLENTVIVPPFVDKTDVDDRTLLDLVPMLEDFVVRDVQDLRAELARLRELGHGDAVAGFKRDVSERQAQREQAAHRGLAAVTGSHNPLRQRGVNTALKR